MRLPLRVRIFLTLLPLLALPAGLGGVAVVLLYHLGGRIDAILRENYDSVVYMEDLNEALERIDSSFTFALAGKEDEARRQFRANWKVYQDNLDRERNNITIHPVEDELVARLAGLTDRYRAAGDAFFAEAAQKPENVVLVEGLNEGLERIDSSFQFAMVGRENEARKQYAQNWEAFRRDLETAAGGLDVPGTEAPLKRLQALARGYREKGEAFYARATGATDRQKDYFDQGGLLDTFKQIKESLGRILQLSRDNRRSQAYFRPGGLLATFTEIKGVSGQILHLNEENMEGASHQARRTARDSLFWFGGGLAATIALGGVLAWYTIRAILRPIRAVTDSATAIGLGNFEQVVQVDGSDELGRLAEAFNNMARQLRHYRKTDYARLLTAQRTSQATIDAFPDPVLVVNSEGQVEMANPAAQRLLGVEGRKTDQAPVLSWQPPEAIRPALSEAIQHQHPYLPEGFDRVVSLRSDGQDLAFLPRILPIRDPYGNTLGAAVLLEDVTRFQLLDQLKSDLVATASHELKTPLTGVRLALHLLLEEAAGPLTPKQAEILLDARDNAERLLNRVNKLLDLARLEQKHDQLDLRPEQPAALLRAAAEAVRPRAHDKGVEVVVEVPPEVPAVPADAQRLGHALDNLLDNAVTYTDRGGKITLSARAEDGAVMLSVSDTGRGIPPEYLPHVFDKFFRVPGQSQSGGTGLGLAIVREIVTAHGGTIACESEGGSGTVFRIRLPVGAAGGEVTDRNVRPTGGAVTDRNVRRTGGAEADRNVRPTSALEADRNVGPTRDGAANPAAV